MAMNGKNGYLPNEVHKNLPTKPQKQFEMITLTDEIDDNIQHDQDDIDNHSVDNAVEPERRKTPGLFSKYIIALRPWSFTASLTPVALGSCLAYKDVGSFNVMSFITTCVTALSVHAAGNLVNTYYDYKKGIDSKKKSDDRTLVDQLLHPNDVATMGGLFYFVGCLGFALLTVISPAKMEHLALIYFGGLSSSFLYTGGLGLKYIALGDLVIFLTFGPVTVLFAHLSQGGQLEWMPLLYALPLALNTSAILHSNNTRDMKSDEDAGIVTLAILIGETASAILFALLLFAPFLIFIIFGFRCSKWFLIPATVVIIAFKLEREFREGNRQKMPVKVAKLNLQMGLLYVFACYLTPTTSLPGFSRGLK